MRSRYETLQTPLVQLLLDCDYDNQDRNSNEAGPQLEEVSPVIRGIEITERERGE